MNPPKQGRLMCDILGEAQDAARACQNWMLAHVPGYTAQLWDKPKQRNKDGKFSIYIDHRVLNALTPVLSAQIAAPNPADDWQPTTE